MKKILLGEIVFLLVVIFMCRLCYADEISEYYDTFNMNTLDEYGDFKTVFRKTMQGDTSYLMESLAPKRLLFSELSECADILKGLLLICMLNGLVGALNFGGGKGSEYMSFMVSRILAAGLCLKALERVIGILTGFADMFLGLVGAAIPITAAVLAVSGRAALSSASMPLMYAACSGIAAAIKIFILPCISFYAVCGLINCISPQGMLTRLAKLIHGFIGTGMKGFGLLFGLILAFERAATAGADGLISKTAVSAVKAVPVVGDVFAAGAESVITLLSAVKGGFGAALTAFMAVGCAVPLAKVLAAAAVFRISAALSEPLGDGGISEMIDTAGGVCSLVFSVMAGLALIFMGAAAILLFGMGG